MVTLASLPSEKVLRSQSRLAAHAVTVQALYVNLSSITVFKGMSQGKLAPGNDGILLFCSNVLTGLMYNQSQLTLIP